VLRSGQPQRTELELPTLDGTKRVFHAQLSALCSERGERHGVLCTADERASLRLRVSALVGAPPT
jgi:hypothetical protein